MPGAIKEPVNVPSLKLNISGHPMPNRLEEALLSIEVENNLYLPDTATLKFVLDVMEEPKTKLADSDMLDVMSQGASLRIHDEANELFDGEIVSVSIEFNSITRQGGFYLLVQAFDRSHQLHRGRKTETFLQMSISDIAKKVIKGAKLKPEVDPVSGVLDYVIQSNQTDWEFLWQLADRVGYEVLAVDDKVLFKRPRQTSGSPIKLDWGEELIQFRSRKSTVKQISDVKVRAWDRDSKKAIIGQANVTNNFPTTADRRSGAAQATSAFGHSSMVVVDYPLANQDQATTLAQSVLDGISGEFIQAEGTTAQGNSKLKPGVEVEISGLGKNSGQYLVTATTHSLNRSEGQSTTFKIGGRNPQTFFPALDGRIKGDHGLSKVQGAVLGVVTNNKDPQNLCRVKIEFPWLDEKVETDWAPIALAGAGADRGFQWIPAVGDQALVVFEHGDIHRPCILGTIWSSKDKPPSPNKDVIGPDGKVDRIQIKSREGQALVINDKSGQRSIGINNPDSKITINQDNKVIEILSNGDINITGQNGKITLLGQDLELKSSGNLLIDASANLEIKAGANLSLKGGAKTDLEGQMTSVKGVQTTVEGGTMAEIKAPMVKIN